MNPYSLLADFVLILHASFIAFVVFGLILIVMGLLRQWRWVRSFWFRLSHLLAIGIVVIQSWMGIICPLTIWEHELRMMADKISYSGSFVAYWLRKIVFYQAEPWVFSMGYTIFAGLILATWIWGRPQGAPVLVLHQSIIRIIKIASKRPWLHLS